MDINEILRGAGLKSTPQRRMVYEAMRNLGHASADDVIREFHRKNPGVTVSTVYRILDTFCRAGLVSKMTHPEGRCCFDITPRDHHHIFSEGGGVVDYDNPELTELIKKELEKGVCMGTEIERISIQIFIK